MEHTEERVTVRATPQRCFEVATDFESYPEWSSEIQTVDVRRLAETEFA